LAINIAYFEFSNSLPATQDSRILKGNNEDLTGKLDELEKGYWL
jgi:hypothetical protein